MLCVSWVVLCVNCSVPMLCILLCCVVCILLCCVVCTLLYCVVCILLCCVVYTAVLCCMCTVVLCCVSLLCFVVWCRVGVAFCWCGVVFCVVFCRVVLVSGSMCGVGVAFFVSCWCRVLYYVGVVPCCVALCCACIVALLPS